MCVQLINPLPSSLFLLPCPNIAVNNGNFFCETHFMEDFYVGYSKPIDVGYYLTLYDSERFSRLYENITCRAIHIKSILTGEDERALLRDYHIQFIYPHIFTRFVPHKYIYLCTCTNFNYESSELQKLNIFCGKQHIPFNAKKIIHDAIKQSPDGTRFIIYENGRHNKHSVVCNKDMFGMTVLKKREERNFWR